MVGRGSRPVQGWFRLGYRECGQTCRRFPTALRHIIIQLFGPDTTGEILFAFLASGRLCPTRPKLNGRRFSKSEPPPRWRVAAIAFFATPPGRIIHVITYRFRGDIGPKQPATIFQIKKTQISLYGICFNKVKALCNGKCRAMTPQYLGALRAGFGLHCTSRFQLLLKYHLGCIRMKK
jgi:hypothetical protein